MATYDPPLFSPDEHNPYAPPRSDQEPEPTQLELIPVEFALDEVLTRSWEIYRDRMGICIGVTIGCFGINYAANLGLQVIMGLASVAQNKWLIGLVIGGAFVAATLLQIWLSIGQLVVMVNVARGRNASFGGVFQGGRFLLPIIVAYILFWLVLVTMLGLAAVPGAVLWAALGKDSAAGPIVLGLGVTAGVVAIVILSLRCSQFTYLIIDRNAGIIESLRDSIKITRGNAGMIFVIYLLTGAINLVGLLACFIGMLFTLPFTVLLLAVTYLALAGQATADPYKKGEPLADLEPL